MTLHFLLLYLLFSFSILLLKNFLDILCLYLSQYYFENFISFYTYFFFVEVIIMNVWLALLLCFSLRFLPIKLQLLSNLRFISWMNLFIFLSIKLCFLIYVLYVLKFEYEPISLYLFCYRLMVFNKK